VRVDLRRMGYGLDGLHFDSRWGQRGRGWPICSVRVDLRRMGYGLDGLHFDSRRGQRIFFPPKFPERLGGIPQPPIPRLRGSLLG